MGSAAHTVSRPLDARAHTVYSGEQPLHLKLTG